jgi:hypothetical protein
MSLPRVVDVLRAAAIERARLKAAVTFVGVPS